MRNEDKTHCPRGHPYEGENLYFTKAGSRQCHKCRIERARRRYDPHRKGQRRGETHPNSKLNVDTVLAIRAASAAGVKQREVAARYGVDQAWVSRIVTRKVWTHV